MSSIFEECIIVFQVLGHHVRIPCIFHGILMVKSNELNISSHFHVERNLFFQSLESEVSLLLSVVPLVLPLSLAFCKVFFRSSFCFLFLIVFFLRSIRLCKSILPKRISVPSGNSTSCVCIRCGTVIACCVWLFHLFLPGYVFPGTASCTSVINYPPSVSCCNNSLRKHLSPAMSCACLHIFAE